MHERWYKQAVIYCLDVETFQDSNGDGVGDFAGPTSRLVCTPGDSGDPAVLALHHEAAGGAVLAVHNLSETEATVDLRRVTLSRCSPTRTTTASVRS